MTAQPDFKPIADIVFGFSDAENYRRRENKDLFNKIFLRTSALKEIKSPKNFFNVGEKGTGKTAYAVYYSNSPSNDLICSHKFIRETDYLKFVQFKKSNHLALSDYSDIWKVIILLLVASDISEKSEQLQSFFKPIDVNPLNSAIGRYTKDAFSPEISIALKLIERYGVSGSLTLGADPARMELASQASAENESNLARFQIALSDIQRDLKDALSKTRLSKSFTLFIDGIDLRPQTVEFSEYLDCVKGLADAVWSLNNDFFPSIRDSKGRIKTMLLLRPDIFNSLGLQNRNTKLKDNSVILNWITDWGSHRRSELFQLADRLFSAQQTFQPRVGQAWDHYFPFDAAKIEAQAEIGDERTSFVALLRYSYHRPRDVLTILDILREIHSEELEAEEVFQLRQLFTKAFRSRYGSYLLGEIKDSLSFYYDDQEYELFLKFFEYLSGRQKFTWIEFEESFYDFESMIETQGISKPDFMQSSADFLQFLFDQNILCYIEDAGDEKFLRWCFRERNSNNISPKVKTGLSYEIHYGLANALNTGKELRKSSESNNSVPSRRGKIGSIDLKNRRGTISEIGLPIDIVFLMDADELSKFQKGQTVFYDLSRDQDNLLVARNVRTHLRQK